MEIKLEHSLRKTHKLGDFPKYALRILSISFILFLSSFRKEKRLGIEGVLKVGVFDILV